MDLEKKLVLKKQLISAAALLPSAFAAVYFAYCLMLGRINIFAVRNIYYAFVPAFLVMYALFVTLMIYLFSEKKFTYNCTVEKAELITFPVIAMTVWINCAMAAWVSPYATPIAFTVLLIGVLVSPRCGLYSGLLSAVASAICIAPPVYFYLPGEFGVSFAMSAVADFVTAFFMLFVINRRYNRFSLTWGAIAVSLGTALVGAVMSLLDGWSPRNFFGGYALGVMGNVVAVCAFTAILPVFEYFSRIWTDFKLAEICGLDQPVLRKMSEEAPGTFNHALNVANLAENCAIAIGIDPYMARACAYYHDMGKMNDPLYFSENQTGYNPHDDLIPEVSVAKIRRHTRDGYEQLRKMRFPDEICKAALEHHGDSPIMFFYTKAKGLGGDVNIEDFRYDCPTPTTKYSAIIMICDICESMTRAVQPESVQALEKTVDKVIKDKLADGQFDDTDITMEELHKIGETIVKVIPGMLHKRIDYAKAKEER